LEKRRKTLNLERRSKTIVKKGEKGVDFRKNRGPTTIA